MAIRARVRIPLQKSASAEFISFKFPGHSAEDVALLFDGWEEQKPVLVRIHSECLTGDVFGSERCDCNHQLHEAIDLMAETGGIILYLRQEGRGIGLYNKLDAYNLQITRHLDTYQANRHLGFPDDARQYNIAAQMLKDLGITSIRLLSNNPKKAEALKIYGIEIEEILPTGQYINPHNKDYLTTKIKNGHIFAYPCL